MIELTTLSYDGTGRAYPPNPADPDSWGKMYMYQGRVYMIVGGQNRKEWELLSNVIRRGLDTYA